MSSFNTSRIIPAPVEVVFKAMTEPEHLVRWWGPAGFTNTFHICEIQNQGRWSYTMHGPDGKDYSNESVFVEVELNKHIMISHLNNPKYHLILSLRPFEHFLNKTVIEFKQTFEKAEVAKAIAHIVIPANEQNLERLEKECLRIIQYNE